MGPRRLALLLVVLAIGAACSLGGGPTGAAHSPAASAPSSPAATTSAFSTPPAGAVSPAPEPLAGAYGVLVSPLNGSASYTVSLIGVDGKVAASKQVSAPPTVSCGNAAAVVPPPVSTSNSGVYYQEGQGGITFMSPSGQLRQAASVPAGTASRRSMFAVSPDDKRIAVVVADYSSSGASTRLYVEDLGGSNHVETFSETGAYSLWPIGWHGTNNLVLAKVPSCTQGGGPFCCGPQELHVVDPATAVRRFTIGSSSCRIAGPPVPAGAVCEDVTNYGATVFNWTAGTIRQFRIGGVALAYLSPNGSHVALVDNNGTFMEDTGKSLAGLFACTWIDDSHVLAGGDAQHQPRVGDISGGSQIPVAAQGDCAGRLPGGL